MKTENKLTLAIIVVLVLIAISFLKDKNESVELEKDTRLESIQIPEKQLLSSQDSTLRQEVENKVSIQEEYKKCFNKEIKNDSIDAVFLNLISLKEYSEPMTNEENYELVSADNQTLVVQYLPQEENSNKVRVFSINSQDGLPDRIKDFPQNQSDTSLKLKGALSLGEIKSKTISTTQTAYDGSMLSIDKKENKIIRAHLITRSFDFECKNQSCLCLKKE